MQFDPNDDVPIFEDREDAVSAQENPDLSRSNRLAAEAVLVAISSGYTAEELSSYETIHQGQADDLKVETPDGVRYYLSRCGIEDGEPFEHTVSIELQIGNRWETIAKYDGGALPDDEEAEASGWRGDFTLAIRVGNEAMSQPQHVAEALRSAAQQIEDHARLGECLIRDVNGNTVGGYKFDGEAS